MKVGFLVFGFQVGGWWTVASRSLPAVAMDHGAVGADAATRSHRRASCTSSAHHAARACASLGGCARRPRRVLVTAAHPGGPELRSRLRLSAEASRAAPHVTCSFYLLSYQTSSLLTVSFLLNYHDCYKFKDCPPWHLFT